MTTINQLKIPTTTSIPATSKTATNLSTLVMKFKSTKMQNTVGNNMSFIVEDVSGLSEHRILKMLTIADTELRSKMTSCPGKDEARPDEIEVGSLVFCLDKMLIGFVQTVRGVFFSSIAYTTVGISRLGGKSAFTGKTVGGISLAEAPALKKALGGASANIAVGISKLGGKSAFIGKAEEDEFGYMLDGILKETVYTSGVPFDPKSRTALAFVTLRVHDECLFMSFCNRSADMPLFQSELNFGPLKEISEDEITFLTGGDGPNLKLMLVTEESGGCRYNTKAEFHGTVQGVKAVETTGAGYEFDF